MTTPGIRPSADARRPEISVVVPAYNEAGVLPELLSRVSNALAASPDHEILVVDDGSSDGTLEFLRSAQARWPRLRYVSLSRNFGHQNALRAGLDVAQGACVISLDADLQHPPELIPELVARWRAGAQVVLTIRSRTGVPWFKRRTAAAFYGLLSLLTDRPPAEGSADFRLLDRAVVDVLGEFPERSLFLRGLVPWMGFRQESVPYAPAVRAAGESKYSVRRMVSLAIQGITATSTRPLLLASVLGVLFSLFAVAFAGYAVYMRMVRGTAITGWASVIVFTGLLGGAQLFVTGIVGAYLGQVLQEVQRRPRYLVKERSGGEQS
ncbi:MAG: glycosyltransferase family 2 protein [Gemmatimonadaceae bacterium]